MHIRRVHALISQGFAHKTPERVIPHTPDKPAQAPQSGHAHGNIGRRTTRALQQRARLLR
ncbi:hypothetical protein ExPCM14_00037 [Escherichia coli]|nr:hypothetical protein ExPCM14_00037 [Escherichia coli]